MQMAWHRAAIGVIPSALLAFALLALPAVAQDFPRTLNIYVGYGSGGGYDTNARLVGRFLGKYLPGEPNVIVQNMPGAGGLKAANWLYDLAPRDGSAIAITGTALFLEPLLGGKEAQFDPQKFTWLGSTATEPAGCAVWHTANIKTMEEFLTRPLLVGGSGQAAVATIYPLAMNAVLGAKLKLIQGYTGSNESLLAMERGEVQVFCGFTPYARPDWVKQGKVTVVAQIGMTRDRSFPDAPLVQDYARNAEDRQVLEFIFAQQSVTRPYLGPPGIPAARAKALRDGLAKTVADSQFRDEAAKMLVDPVFMTGEDIAALLRKLYASPPQVVARAKTIMGR
jgi:tripartite-type tricarboxylate transporter receptor subunit TctC